MSYFFYNKTQYIVFVRRAELRPFTGEFGNKVRRAGRGIPIHPASVREDTTPWMGPPVKSFHFPHQ